MRATGLRLQKGRPTSPINRGRVKTPGAGTDGSFVGGGRSPRNLDLLALARQVFSARRERDQLFDLELFGEPAWDIVLALYCFPFGHSSPTVSGLASSVGLAQPTCHRWTKKLVAKGLIESGQSDTDARKQWIRLSAAGFEHMDNWAEALRRGLAQSQGKRGALKPKY